MIILKTGGHRIFEHDDETAAIVSNMLIDLEKNGMDAVRNYSRQLDQWDPKSFELSKSQIREAINNCDDQLRKDTEFCQNNVRSFAKAQLSTLHPLEIETMPGVILGHKHIPVTSVGSYIPGGRYPMFGSAQMSIIPAKVAGVEQVIACTPPVKEEGWFPATINAMATAGADRIFVLGGVQAFALMAFGMGEVRPADILCGAGNKYVAEAKRQLYGRCGIDLLAGPTEIGVIADDTSDPVVVACDVLGQAEHDPNSGQIVVCLSEEHGKRILKEIERQLGILPTRAMASQSWQSYGSLICATSRDEAISLMDDWAPEHLELLVEDKDYYFNRLKNYGSLFIGEETTVAYGDKSIGTNHILPTGRAARYTGGVWVGKFLKTVTYQKMTKEASLIVGEVTSRQCRVERMIAHALTADLRVDRYGKEAR
ncbi:MAG: histidinol dehydrogenase [Sphaerochaetaceae bacterium]|nr:histidinol dehydrogenase [Sphaerochaetaceae bacterium]